MNGSIIESIDATKLYPKGRGSGRGTRLILSSSEMDIMGWELGYLLEIISKGVTGEFWIKTAEE